MNLPLLLIFIVGFILLILIHEFGHFLAARWLNVEVEEFGIGLPPRITTLFVYKGTAFTLNWIPFGGFVRPKGENDPTVEGGLAAASPWVRLGVMFAGPFMNLIAAIVLGTLLFMTYGHPKPLIEEVSANSPAAMVGLQPGDLVLTVNGSKVYTSNELITQTYANLDKLVTITYQRNGQIFTATLTPRSTPPEGEGPMGVKLSAPQKPVSIATASFLGVREIYQMVSSLAHLPMRLLSGQAKPGDARLVGFKGMYDILSTTDNPLWFFMMISASLGIMNLLPIPALDGGRIFFTLPEIILRRRIPPDYENAINFVGLVLLLLLLFYVNIQDFLNPLQLPH